MAYEKGILHLPDEMLTEIILFLTPRERLSLGDSCRRLRALVFEDRRLLRNLDFSKKASLVRMTDIQPYFSDEDACRYILRVDARNVECLRPSHSLNNSIGRAINLVEVDIRGTVFEDIRKLHSFLEPLQRLERLAINWPESSGNDMHLWETILQKPFGKLVYLAARFEESIPTTFTRCLSLCEQLEELFMESMNWYETDEESLYSWGSTVGKLRNLKIAHYQGVDVFRIKRELIRMLPDPKAWTDFQLFGSQGWGPREFYIERDVEVCNELLRSKRLGDFLYTDPEENFGLKWTLNPDYLMLEVLRLTHEGVSEALRILHDDVPESLCCLTPSVPDRRHLLKVGEAKMLLKDPQFQVSQLCLQHILDLDCDAHLLVSAFPNLSELVLSGVINQDEPRKVSHFQTRLRKRGSSPVPEERVDSKNRVSSFKMLVKNTPNLKHFRLDSEGVHVANYDWDLDTLTLISGWRNLETLHINYFPCEYAEFLVEVGKKCKNLRKLFLRNIWSANVCGDEAPLLQMLDHCRNLRDVEIDGLNVDQSRIFSFLAKNAYLGRVKLGDNCTKHSLKPWLSSFQNMIRKCTRLNTIICRNTLFETADDLSGAMCDLQGLEAGFSGRPDFRMQMAFYAKSPKYAFRYIGHITEDLPPNEPFPVDYIRLLSPSQSRNSVPTGSCTSCKKVPY